MGCVGNGGAAAEPPDPDGELASKVHRRVHGESLQTSASSDVWIGIGAPGTAVGGSETGEGKNVHEVIPRSGAGEP